MMTVFDIGMYDGSDTAYYLESGYQVVAVEANRDLVTRARERFASQVSAGLLTCIHAAVSDKPGPVELILSGDDLGSSSVIGDMVAKRNPIGTVTVPGTTMAELLAEHGVPHYLKVDIEGADRVCVLGLTADTRPTYLSFELGEDVEELVDHARSIGYDRFKLIEQDGFRELANQACLRDRIVRKLAHILGYAEPRMIRRGGRFFASGHSSGPVPWKSDGRWYPGDETLERCRWALAQGLGQAWYDVHATAET